MRSYVNEAIEELCRRHEAQSRVFAVNAMRKVAALAVAAMEIHGAPHRTMIDLAQSCELHSVKCDDKKGNP
jgi:hypothetical protein